MELLNDLIKPITRDERQHESVTKWLKAKGHGTVVAGTGVGKTYIAIKAIQRLRKRYPDLDVLVLVPTTTLKAQWIETLQEQGIDNVSVQVMMGASQRKASCGLLILDEFHRCAAETISNIFNVITYKAILGLTATFERLDGRDRILAKYAPVCDEIPIQVAMANGWVSPYKDYVVIIDVPDIQQYKVYNREFIEHFGFFDFQWNVVMGLVGKDGFKRRKEYTNQICKNSSEWKDIFKQVTYHSVGLMRTLKARKAFIANHPEKIRVAQKIINARKDKKIITFCSNVKVAESFGNGYIFTGKNGKKKNRMTLSEFSKEEKGILHTCRLAEEGISIGNLSVGIMLGVNSSKTKAIQTLGRVVRVSPGKQAEFFTIVINDTAETEWMKKSRSSDNFEIIDEEALDHVLNNEPYETYKRKLQKLNFRF
jgi:superfamily II DNA or RNA helicase